MESSITHALTPAHVLLIPYPCQGHLSPFMELAKRLASLGLLTTLATIHTFADRLSAALATASDDDDSSVSVVGVPDGLPPDYERRDLLDPRLQAAVENDLEGALGELVRSLSHAGRPVTCLIGDLFLPWMPHLAQAVKLPEVVFWPQNASCFAIFSHLDQIISHGYNPFNHTTTGRIIKPNDAMELVTCIPGLPPMHPSALPFHVLDKRAFTWLEALIRTRFTKLHQALRVLGNSCDELEPNVCAVLGSKLYNVGPLIAFPSHQGSLQERDSNSNKKLGSSASLWQEDDCIHWLDKQPLKSVVYISFGSVAKCSISQVQDLAQGIAASNQRFLWVIRKNMIVEKVVNVQDALPPQFLEDMKEKGKMINWAPQASVLAHPSVGGFFSHCGWNSCMESLSFGVPILGWPFLHDQLTNCWLICNEWKVGLKVQTNHDNFLDHLEVQKCLMSLMEGDDAKCMRARSTALKHITRQSLLNGNGSSYQNLKHLVTMINHLSTKQEHLISTNKNGFMI